MKKLTVKTLQGQIRDEISAMLKEVSDELEVARETSSGPRMFERTTDLSTQLGHYLDVQKRLEQKGLISR